MKRKGDEERQVSKEAYFANEDKEVVIDFSKAAPEILSSRRMVTALRQPDKKEAFCQHVEILNRSFFEWFKEQIEKNPSYELSDAFQDYIDYATSLEDRFLRSYGEVLTFGSGDCGQLAHGIDNYEDLEVKYPRVVYSLRDKNVYGIACGGLHTAVYTDMGRVYTWGCGDDGSLGRPGEECAPCLVEGPMALETIIGIDCGDCHTTAVSTKGDIWGWGSYKDKEGKTWFNPDPALTTDPKQDLKKKQMMPIKIAGISNAVEVACGASFNFARTSDGLLYSWGIGESGELGRYAPPIKKGEDYDTAAILKYHVTPNNVRMARQGETAAAQSSSTADADRPIVSNVKSFGCGNYHSLVAVVGDLVYACGLNNYGQLGLADMSSVCTFMTPVPALSGCGVVQLKGGVHHSLALSSSGEMLAFGRGDSGQLGLKKISDGEAGACSYEPVKPQLPPGAGAVTTISCGGNHNLVVTSGNELYSWGYGDMLALGHGKEQDEPLPRKVNFSKASIVDISITQVAGGGQHSAIVGRVTTL